MTKLHWFITILVVVGSVYCMSHVLRVAARAMANVTSASYVAGTHSMAFVTVPDDQMARTLAKGLLEKKLAACVNIIPNIKSVYEWEGKIEEDSELILMIKTRTSRVDDVAQYVREHHSYDVAEVISTPIVNGNPPYLDWIGQIVPDKH